MDAVATTFAERRIPLRTLLLALLTLEIALVGSLHLLGWLGTAGAFRWGASALIAFLPLALACHLISSQRFRFSMRSLLIAMSLLAVFMFVTVQPLYEALESRRGSRALLAFRAWVSTYSSNDTYFKQLRYDPRLSRPDALETPPTPAWLRPLAGDRLVAPVDEAIQEIHLDTDAQVAAFAANASRFRTLNCVMIRTTMLSPAAMQQLKDSLPQVPSLVRVHLSCPIPTGLLPTLTRVRAVSIDSGSRTLKSLGREQVQELVALPSLQQLEVRRARIGDADLPLLAQSTTLRHVTLLISGADKAGLRELVDAMPNARIFGAILPDKPLQQFSRNAP